MAGLETNRLIIRPTQREDVDDVYACFSDPNVMKYRACGVLDGQATVEWVNRVVETGLSYHGFVGKVHQVVLKATGRVIGYCYLDVPWPEGYRDLAQDGRLDFVDITYGLAAAHWGNGYATEAAQATMSYGFDVAGVEKIGAAVNPGNVASIRVLCKLGLHYRRQIEWPRQGKVDFYSLSKTEDESRQRLECRTHQ